MSNNKKRFPLYRAFALGIVAIAVIGTVVFASLNNNKQKDTASASVSQTDCAALKMEPGTTCKFKLDYSNGEGQPTTNSILKIFIGSTLIVDQASFTDEMSVGGVSQGVGNMVYNNIVDTSDPGSSWGTTLLYLPGSAKTGTTTKTPGDLPANTTGTIYFSVKLRDDVLSLNKTGTTKYQVGDVLQPPTAPNFNTFQGVLSQLEATEIQGSKIVPGRIAITILASSNPAYTTTGSLTGNVGNNAGGTITIQGSPALSGNATYTNGANCSISGTITNNVFTPTGTVPAGCPVGSNTSGKITAGTTEVATVTTNFDPVVSSSSSSLSSTVSSTTSSIANSSTASSSNSSLVSNSNCENKFGDNCRLYFVGTDNATVAWNSTFQTNTAWNKAQKYKDGVAKLVFDNIKTNDGTTINDGSSCEFKLVRYGNAEILKTYTATTTNGKAEVNFPVVDQTVNYYTVAVDCTETTSNEMVKDYDRLVLIVGGLGNTAGPGIDF